MRRPTVKEALVMKRCIEGLQGDLEALVLKKADPSVTLYDVLGTMGVNLSALHSIHHQLSVEEKKDD
ncbi:MAG: hypothetical protein WDA41_09905 [Candidatus Neomarinimicrobiota bacterium]|jgi:hypothetical protein